MKSCLDCKWAEWQKTAAGRLQTYDFTERGTEMNESKKDAFIQGRKCDCCTKPAVGWEPRFGYFYCEDHEHTRPVDIPNLRERKDQTAEKLFGFDCVIDGTLPNDTVEVRDGDKLLAKIIGIDSSAEAPQEPVGEVRLSHFADDLDIPCPHLYAPLEAGTKLYAFPPDAQAEIAQLRLKHQVACDTITRMQEEREERRRESVTTKQYIEASVESANEFNTHHEEMLQEIAKRDARIASLIAAGAEYQRQCFEQAAEIYRLKGVISRCKEAMETCCKGVFRDNGFEVSRKDYDSEMVEQALAAIKEIEK